MSTGRRGAALGGAAVLFAGLIAGREAKAVECNLVTPCMPGESKIQIVLRVTARSLTVWRGQPPHPPQTHVEPFHDVTAKPSKRHGIVRRTYNADERASTMTHPTMPSRRARFHTRRYAIRHDTDPPTIVTTDAHMLDTTIPRSHCHQKKYWQARNPARPLAMSSRAPPTAPRRLPRSASGLRFEPREPRRRWGCEAGCGW